MALPFIVWLGIVGQTPALDLTEDERRVVLELAEKALKEKDLFKGKIYLTNLEVHRDTRDRESPRNVLVTYYRYEGNLAIFVSVNIGRKEVTKVESEPDCPTCLAPEELERAIKLSRASPEVRKALAKHGPPEKFEVDALVAHTVDEKSPIFGKRAVRLFLRQGRTYLLYAPTVEVNLTDETVRVLESGDQGHK